MAKCDVGHGVGDHGGEFGFVGCLAEERSGHQDDLAGEADGLAGAVWADEGELVLVCAGQALADALDEGGEFGVIGGAGFAAHGIGQTAAKGAFLFRLDWLGDGQHGR